MSVQPEPALTEAQVAAVRAAIAAERERAVARVAAFQRNFDDIVASSEGSPPDDEHDPEGATIAFERAQVSALLQQGRGYLADLDRAEHALSAGTYGSCARCGSAISIDRLLARPTATSCVTCAAR